MLRVAYLFERFPSLGQTFAYREVAELKRQGADVQVFSIRRPTNEPLEDWDPEIVRAVRYLPDERTLVKEVETARDLPASAKRALEEWGRKTDFLRLHQACWIGLRLQAEGIERAHAHFAGMAARTAYWLKRFFGIDYSLTANANDIFAPREFEISLPMLFAEATAVVTVSDFAVARLRERFPQHAARFHRVYNGLAVAEFQAGGAASVPARIISIGRLIEKKGFTDLVDACAKLRARDVEFRSELVGDGPLRPHLEAQIAAHEMGTCVRLRGAQTQREIIDAFAEASVFALACKPATDGDMDNLPTVIMEAMAAGLPIVSTHVAGIPEMVVDGVNGQLVAPGDTDALADALARIISDPQLGREMGRRGREMANEKFSIEANVRTLAKILSSPSAKL